VASVLLLLSALAMPQTATPAKAIALEQQGKLEEAAQAWKAVTESNPRDAAAFASLGVVRSRQQKYLDAAVAYLRSADDDLSRVARASARQIAAAFWISIPALVLPFVIRTAVVEGVATATEVSTIGVAYTVIVGILVYRQFDWRRLYPMLVDTASLSGSILLIVGTATAMAWALTQSGFSRDLAAAMTGMAALRGGAGLVTVASAESAISQIASYAPEIMEHSRRIAKKRRRFWTPARFNGLRPWMSRGTTPSKRAAGARSKTARQTAHATRRDALCREFDGSHDQRCPVGDGTPDFGIHGDPSRLAFCRWECPA